MSALRQQCDEYHIPYFGPTQEECDEADFLGDLLHDMAAQHELDNTND